MEIIAAKLKGETQQDDKTMLMERTIQLVATLPNHSKTQEVLTNDFIDKLWNSLDHPPLLYMGDNFKYRLPDGSNNVSSVALKVRLRLTMLIPGIEPAYAEAGGGRTALCALV